MLSECGTVTRSCSHHTWSDHITGVIPDQKVILSFLDSPVTGIQWLCTETSPSGHQEDLSIRHLIGQRSALWPSHWLQIVHGTLFELTTHLLVTQARDYFNVKCQNSQTAKKLSTVTSRVVILSKIATLWGYCFHECTCCYKLSTHYSVTQCHLSKDIHLS